MTGAKKHFHFHDDRGWKKTEITVCSQFHFHDDRSNNHDNEDKFIPCVDFSSIEGPPCPVQLQSVFAIRGRKTSFECLPLSDRNDRHFIVVGDDI